MTDNIEEIKKKMNDAIDTARVEEMVKNNEIEFIYKETKYKVRRPTAKERQEAYENRAKKHMGMLDNETFKPEEIIKLKWKKQGIDIDELDKKMMFIEAKKNEFQMKLGKALETKAEDSELKIYREEIQKCKDEQQTLSIKRTQYLEFSIENQVNIFTYSYFTYLITEKEVEGKWIKAFGSYDEYLNVPEELINTITWRASLILLPTEILA